MCERAAALQRNKLGGKCPQCESQQHERSDPLFGLKVAISPFLQRYRKSKNTTLGCFLLITKLTEHCALKIARVAPGLIVFGEGGGLHTSQKSALGIRRTLLDDEAAASGVWGRL